MKNFNRLSTKILSFFLLSVCLTGQADIGYAQTSIPELEQKFSVEELKDDFKSFRGNLEKLHIGLYSYTPKSELDKAFNQIEAELDRPMTALEFFNKFTRLNKLIGNVHTGIRPPKKIWDAIKKELPLFPFEVYWDKDSLFILKNLSDNLMIKDGSKIKTINGKSAEIIFEEMKNSLRRDGYNESYPIERAAYSFAIIYAAQNEMPDSFEIELNEPSGEIKTVKVKPLPTKKLNENHLARYKKPRIAWEKTKDTALKLSITGDVATITIRIFEMSLIEEKGQKWKKFFKRSFKEIRKKGVKHLIIDLRDNNGGQTKPGINLIKYLTDKPFNFFKSINANVGKIPNPKSFVSDGSIENFELYNWVKKGDLYELKEKAEFKMHKPVKKPFQGKLYVLINAFSNSATGTFAGQVKSLTNAIFIGQETGGNPNQTVARQIINMELPNSKIQVSIPLVLSVKNVNFENKGHGIIPDHPIKPSIKDVLNKNDSVMEFTLSLIRRAN